MKKFYLVLLTLSVCSISFPQISDITRLPVQNQSQSIRESAPVWFSENEIIIFYVSQSKDTIFSTKSTNRGISWEEPKVVQVVGLLNNQDALDLSALYSVSGRILLAWSIQNESMKLIYSDDAGENWSQPISIPGAGGYPVDRYSYMLNLTQWKNNKICLSFTGYGLSNIYYKLSSDDGVNWSANPFEFPETSPYYDRELSIVSTDQHTLLGIFERRTTNVIDVYFRRSTDLGLNWSEPQKVAGEIYHESRPKVSVLGNGSIIVAYLRDNQTLWSGEHDIYYKVSLDDGITWSEESKFTKYIGEDIALNLSTFENKTFITFSSEKYSVNVPGTSRYQICYGILQESEDKFTPPKVYSTFIPSDLIDYEKKQFVYRAEVRDDETVKSVTTAMDDFVYTGAMFDDGLHNDEEAGDNIFGNIFPFVNQRFLNGYTLTVNNIYLPFNNAGVLANVNVIYGQEATIVAADNFDNKSVFNQDLNLGGQGGMGQYDGGGFLFSAGFFLSGYENGNLFVNGVASGDLVEDYLPGKVGSNSNDPSNVLYIVNKNDPPFGTSWQRWKDAVLLGADFYDGDNDGVYNPIDKNLNETWDTNEDMPPLLGDEIAWCVYNDGVPAHERRFLVDPIGIEVQQTLFASSYPDLEDVIFIKYKVTNTGLVSDVLDSVYFSPWDDTDIGDATDDLGGSDTLLNSIFTYNSPFDVVYGDNPPAVFTSLLQGPLVESVNVSDTAYIKNGQIIGEEFFPGYKNLNLYSFTGYAKGDPDQGDPQNVQHVLNYVHARDRHGYILNPCDTVYGKVYGNVDCSQVNPMFWFSGDPVTEYGWLDNRAMDDRKFSSIGPISLEKNKPVEIILALVVGRGTNNLNSITVARGNVQRAIEEYQNNFASMTYSPPPPVPITEYILYQNYPNPFNPTTTIRYEIPKNEIVTITIYDLLGQKVKTLVNEFKTKGRYEVKFNSAGLASGIYIYQLIVNKYIVSKKMVLVK